MDLSGVIFVVLAVAWAGYLIPKALRHHDEVARTRSIDKFSSTMRVLAHREPVSGREAQLVVASDPASRRQSRPTRPVPRSSTAVAARRRRRLLLLLLLVDVAVSALAYYGYLRRWAPAIPGGLTVGWLLLCRIQVRRLARRTTRRSTPVSVEPIHLNEQGFAEVTEDEDTASIPVEELRAAIAGGDGLWDPLPVTLPTYVSKPAAKRTVRTIDLAAPDVWSSGRSEADSALVAQAAEREESERERAIAADERAVGS
ncbi:MAG: divisome protein SepX/GlpR [Nocardioidaceae bacterium]